MARPLLTLKVRPFREATTRYILNLYVGKPLFTGFSAKKLSLHNSLLALKPKTA